MDTYEWNWIFHNVTSEEGLYDMGALRLIGGRIFAELLDLATVVEHYRSNLYDDALAIESYLTTWSPYHTLEFVFSCDKNGTAITWGLDYLNYSEYEYNYVVVVARCGFDVVVTIS